MNANLIKRQNAPDLTHEVIAVIEEAIGAYGAMDKSEIYTEVYTQTTGIDRDNVVAETNKALELLVGEGSLEIQKDFEKELTYFDFPI